MKQRIFVPLLVMASLLLSVVPNAQAGDCRYRGGHGRYHGGYHNSDVAVAGLIGLVSGLFIGAASRPAYYPPPRPVYAPRVYAPPVYRPAPVVGRSSYRAVRYAPAHQRVYVGRVCR